MKINKSYLYPIRELVSQSDIPMALFSLDLDVISANAGGKELLGSRSSEYIYPVIRKSLFDKKDMSKKIHFKRKIWMLNSYPIFVESESVAGVLIIVKEN